jgi:DNA polymerase III epsilon subunit-like protein
MSERPRFIYLDIETTGLDFERDEITEVAWILDDGTERQFFIEHRASPSGWVLQNTDYSTRIKPASKVPVSAALDVLAADCMALKTPYLVGACIAFDDRFLRRANDGAWAAEAPYHYHVLDIEAVAMGATGAAFPGSLKDLRAALGIAGQNEAEHSALSDAREVKTIHDALLALRGKADAPRGLRSEAYAFMAALVRLDAWSFQRNRDGEETGPEYVSREAVCRLVQDFKTKMESALSVRGLDREAAIREVAKLIEGECYQGRAAAVVEIVLGAFGYNADRIPWRAAVRLGLAKPFEFGDYPPPPDEEDERALSPQPPSPPKENV